MSSSLSTVFLAGVVAFAVSLVLVPVAIYLATLLGLVDEPSERKRHMSPTPLVGGFLIFTALCISNIIFEQISWSFLGWISLVLFIGVLDDLFDVSYKIRLGVHAAIVLGIFFTDSLLVTNIGSIFWGNTTIYLIGGAAILFTVIGVIGAINSVNMIDGVDGLLSSIVITSFVALFILGVEARSTELQVSLGSIAMLVGSISAFAIVNCRFFGLRKALVFMGDSGSTMLGFFLVYALIAFSQEPSWVISPILAGWILGLPLLDACAVIVTRVLDGKAPFHPDRRHLHHLLMDYGFSVNRTVIVLLFFHLALIVFASVMYLTFGNAADPYLFWGFLALVLVRVAFGKVFSRYEGESKRRDDSFQIRTNQVGNAVAATAGLRLQESREKKNDSVQKADVERLVREPELDT